MGMFDNVRCKYPLPWPEVQDATWQSKCTPAQYLNEYEIREDGTLWHLAYDARTEINEEALLGFRIHRDNERWEQVDYTGELEIHEYIATRDGPSVYYSVRFWFRDGAVKDAVFRKRDDTWKL